MADLEETGTVQEPSAPAEPSVSNSAIRESNIFRQQAAEHTRLKQELDTLKSSLDDTKKAEELKKLEDEQSYKEAVAKMTEDFTSKLNNKDAELSRLMAQVEHKELTQELLMAGATSTVSSDFLANQYKSLEGDDKPELGKWIESLKENPDFAAFFKGPVTKQPNNPDTGGGHPRNSGPVPLDPKASSADMIKAALALIQ